MTASVLQVGQLTEDLDWDILPSLTRGETNWKFDVQNKGFSKMNFIILKVIQRMYCVANLLLSSKISRQRTKTNNCTSENQGDVDESVIFKTVSMPNLKHCGDEYERALFMILYFYNTLFPFAELNGLLASSVTFLFYARTRCPYH